MTSRCPVSRSGWPPHAAAALCIVLLAAVLAAGCVAFPGLSDKTHTIPEDNFIFLEHHINTNGITVSGECSPRMMIDFPLYSFDRDTRILTATVPEGEWVNESLLMFYGTGESLSGVEGGGARTSAGPVYALPKSINTHGGNVTIDSITADGTVNFYYNDRKLSLKPGESRENITRVIEIRNRPEYSTNCTAEIITTDYFYNAGLIDKKTIVFR